MLAQQVLGSIFLNFLSVPAIVWTLKKICCKFDRPCTTVILEDIVVRTASSILAVGLRCA